MNDNLNEGEKKGMPNLETTASAAEPEKSFNLGKELFEWFYTIVIAFAIVFVIKGFLFDMVKVDGLSMFPTLNNADRLIVREIGYTPNQGDIIILDSNYEHRRLYYDDMEMSTGKKYSAIGKFFNYFNLDKSIRRRYYVKRIVALPGQTVDIKDGKLFIDGEVLEEPYYQGDTMITDVEVEYPLTVKDGYVFVLGDNRSNSTDSRTTRLGQVPFEAIKGKAIFRVFPFTTIGTV